MNETEKITALVKAECEIFRAATGILITYHEGGKMGGKFSLSTSCLLNPICRIRAKVAGSVCAACYAERLLKFRRGAADAYAENFRILTSTEIAVDRWPDLHGLSDFRLESFGDVCNVRQVRNYFNFARRNPETQFVAWSKNPGIYAAEIRKSGKPENFRLIFSSMFLDQPDDPAAEPFADIIDKKFVVWSTAATAAMSGREISCGGKNCAGCDLCYGKSIVTEINEIKR